MTNISLKYKNETQVNGHFVLIFNPLISF